MATGKVLNGKPYAGNPHVWLDEGETVSATPRRGSLFCTIAGTIMVVASMTAHAFDWAAITVDGVATVPSSTTAIVSNADISVVSELTAIKLSANSSRLRFDNTEPLTLNAKISGTSGGSFQTPQILMSDGAGTVTFNGDVYMTGAGAYFTLGNCVVNGKFGSNANYYYVKARSGCTVTLSPTAKVERRYLGYFYGQGTYCVQTPLPYGADSFMQIHCGDAQAADFRFGASNLLDHAGRLYYYNPDRDATVDLNGFDQRVMTIYGGTMSAAASPRMITVKSDTAATLTFNQSSVDATYYPASSKASLRFIGGASLVHASKYTNEFVNGVSTTTGRLDVTKGYLKLTGNARWRGPLVRVTGGRLVADVAAGAFGSDTAVEVSSPGVLELPAGVSAIMKSLTIDGDTLDLGGASGITVAELRGLGYTCIEGEGSIILQCNYYVDDVEGDDENNNGRSAASPFKTIKRALDVASPAGGTVYVAEGVYGDEPGDEVMGEAGDWSRVVVPENVTLKAAGRCERTVILGRKATTILSGGGCGEDSARCAYLKSGAKIDGFTLTGGYSTQTSSGTKKDGGGFCAAKFASEADATIVGCIISNNVASNLGGAGFGGRCFGCRFYNNNAVLTYGKGVRSSYLYNCFVKDSLGINGMASVCYAVVNCTFSSPLSTSVVLHAYQSSDVINSVFDTVSDQFNSMDGATYYNCLFTKAPNQGTTNSSCRVVSSAEIGLGAEGTLTNKSSVAVGFGSNERYAAAMAAYSSYADVDCFGSQRVYNGTIDAGASEYDMRGDFAEDIPGSKFNVDAASPGVVETYQRKIRLFGGDSIELSWRAGANRKPRMFSFAVTDGTLEIFVNGVLAKTLAGDGTWTCDGKSENDSYRFSYSGGGVAEIVGSESCAGMLIVFE